MTTIGPAAAPRRRGKIVCTLGPATAAPDRVAALVAAGMDGARLNFSHGDHADRPTRSMTEVAPGDHQEVDVGGRPHEREARDPTVRAVLVPDVASAEDMVRGSTRRSWPCTASPGATSSSSSRVHRPTRSA
jgi:hypothetical protein